MEKGDTTLIHFLTKEGLQIQEAYGNHASFVMMAIGNELSGDQDAMVDMIARSVAKTDGIYTHLDRMTI